MLPMSPPPFAQVAARWAAAACALLGLLLPASGQQAPLPQPVSFDQFFRRPVGPRGIELSDELRAADGQWVSLSGYMVARERPQPGRFLLAPRPVQMSEHADGEADDLPPATVTVWLSESQRDRMVAPQRGLLTLVGTLSVGRAEDVGGRVSWVRLMLPGDALAGAPDAFTRPYAMPYPQPHRH